ncbi:MAG TPA: 2-phosphosulfolactate phosphatase [Candidatus Angelobacter sp.]|nr:2-phosphosulfolactate phosphatase [Candidatus Angelobacter sp.]
MQRTVKIDCLPESVERYKKGYAVVAVDVVRATTTAITAILAGRRCFPVPNLEIASSLSRKLTDPLMVGELSGDVPNGFEVTNSPAILAGRTDIERPMILLSSSGSKIMYEAQFADAGYVACLRNYSAQVEHLARHHSRVVIIGAGSRGEFREEDQLCCAWIGRGLLHHGFVPEDQRTADVIERWRDANVEDMLISNSIKYLRRTNQLEDLDYILAHIDDVASAFPVRGEEVVQEPLVVGQRLHSSSSHGVEQAFRPAYGTTE